MSNWNPEHVSKAALIEKYRFATSDAATADDTELTKRASRIRALEAENARLREVLGEALDAINPDAWPVLWDNITAALESSDDDE